MLWIVKGRRIMCSRSLRAKMHAPPRKYIIFEKQGFRYLQFIPCLEPFSSERGESAYSLSPKDYAEFLVKIFNLWLSDLLKGNYISIRHIDNQLSVMLGRPPEMCSAFGCCNIQYVIEADKSVYPCDFMCSTDIR